MTVTEFSPSFDRFDRAVLAGGLLFVGTAGALQSTAALTAGFAWVAINSVRWIIRNDIPGRHLRRLAELRAEHVKRAREIVEKAMQEAEAKVAAASRLTDDQLWLKGWQDAPVAFWLCPDLFKPGTSEIDWGAVERGPPKPSPTFPVVDPKRVEEAVRKSKANATKELYHNRAKFDGLGFLPAEVETYRVNPATDHYEVQFFDGRRMVLDRAFLHSMTPEQRIAFVKRQTNPRGMSEWEEIRDIIRKLRMAVHEPRLGFVEREVIHAGKSVLFTEDLHTGEMVEMNLTNPTIEEARRYARLASLEGYEHLWDDEEDLY